MPLIEAPFAGRTSVPEAAGLGAVSAPEVLRVGAGAVSAPEVLGVDIGTLVGVSVSQGTVTVSVRVTGPALVTVTVWLP